MYTQCPLTIMCTCTCKQYIHVHTMSLINKLTNMCTCTCTCKTVYNVFNKLTIMCTCTCKQEYEGCFYYTMLNQTVTCMHVLYSIVTYTSRYHITCECIFNGRLEHTPTNSQILYLYVYMYVDVYTCT